MEFGELEDAYAFYNAYARRIGFLAFEKVNVDD
jgi:hypothetical protein